MDYTAIVGTLDLFELMVSYVAGSILLSLLIWALVILITGIMGRLSLQSILIIIIVYFAAVGVGYVGALVAVPLFLFAGWYMVTGILNYVNTLR